MVHQIAVGVVEGTWGGPDGALRCKETKDPILTADVGRSIWEDGLPGGSGEVRTVTHFNCEGCNPGATPPRHGHPIPIESLVWNEGS